MSLNSFLQFLVPKDKKFFPLFHKHAQLLVDIAQTLHDAANLKDPDERMKLFKKINNLEDDSDELTRKINFELSKNFLTPFDREDIYSLTRTMNQVADLMDSVSNRMKIYQVEKVKKSIRKITAETLIATENIQEAIVALEGFKDLDAVTKACDRIHKIEEKVDEIFDREVLKMFSDYDDVKEIIIYKDILSALENATDKCKDVADVLEGISVKHS